MKIKFLISILLIIPFTITAQSDSISFYLKVEPVKAKAYSKRALTNANSILNSEAPELILVEHIGDEYANANAKSEALEIFISLKKILDRQNDLVNSVKYGDVALKIAELFYRQGKIDEAIDYTWIALKTYKNMVGKRSRKFLNATRFFGDLYYIKGNYLLAERIYETDQNICNYVYGNFSNQFALSLIRIGLIEEIKGDLSAAETYFALAAEKVLKNSGRFSTEYADILVSQGQLYFQKGAYTASEALFRQAIGIYQRNKQINLPAFAIALRSIARVNIELNNFSDGRDNLLKALSILQYYYSEEHPEYAITLIDMAKVFMEAQDFNVAKGLVNHSLQISKQILSEKHPAYVQALSMKADIEKITGNLTDSETDYITALDTLKQYMGERNNDYAMIQSKLANLYYKQGDYERALGMHQMVLELRKDILDDLHPRFGESISDIAQIYWVNGQLTLAETNFERSTNNFIQQYQRYFTFLSEREKSYFYNRVSLYFERFNNFALERSKKNPAVLSAMYNNQLTTKAVLFHATQEMRKGVLESNDEALVEKYIRWLQLKELISKVYKLPKREIDERGINIDSLEGNANSLEKELSLRSEILNKKNREEIGAVTWQNIQAALTPNEAAIELVRFQQFLPDSGGYFTEKVFYGALIITKKTKSNPSFVLFENGKEMEERFLKFYRNSTKFQLEDDVSYFNFWAKIAAHPELKGVSKIYLSPDGVYHQINLNSLYNPNSKKFLIDEVIIHIVTNTRDVLKIKSGNEGLSNLTERTSLLVGFPDYYYIFDQNDDGIPDLSPINTNQKQTSTREINELFEEGISDLPGTKNEIESVADIFERYSRKANVYLGIEAFENAIKAKEVFFKPPLILHVATHGFFRESDVMRNQRTVPIFDSSDMIDFSAIKFSNDEMNPLMRSGILLSSAGHAYRKETLLNEVNAILKQKKYEDGVLSAYEAMNLNLTGTELVVLSACETGLGEVKNGEGVYGLQRSLQTAGAKSIIMSLWKVDDEATSRFMINFYEFWFKTGNKREAFREAQLKIREDFPSPFFWGAFVMVGE